MQPSTQLLRLLRAVEREEQSSLNLLRLTAYESKPSELVRKLAASPLGTDYHLGSLADHGIKPVVDLHGLTLRGLPGVSSLEAEASEYACEALSAAGVEFRPLSGVHAVLCTLLTCTEPGDTVYSIHPEDGGHFATNYLLRRMGRESRYLPWDKDNFTIDVSRFGRMLASRPPALVLIDHGLPLAPQPVVELRNLLSDRTVLVYDASHALGLITAGRFQDPLREGADVLQGNTHKSFPGVQKAIIATKTENLAKKISGSLSDGLVSSQHTHHALATYVAFLEMRDFGESYANAMLANATRLATALEGMGALVVGPRHARTNSHQVFVASGNGLSARIWAERLIRAGISVNARKIHGVYGIRLGVQSVTRSGMGLSEMDRIAELLMEGTRGELRRGATEDVRNLSARFPHIRYSYDGSLGLSA